MYQAPDILQEFITIIMEIKSKLSFYNELKPITLKDEPQCYQIKSLRFDELLSLLGKQVPTGTYPYKGEIKVSLFTKKVGDKVSFYYYKTGLKVSKQNRVYSDNHYVTMVVDTKAGYLLYTQKSKKVPRTTRYLSLRNWMKLTTMFSIFSNTSLKRLFLEVFRLKPDQEYLYNILKTQVDHLHFKVTNKERFACKNPQQFISKVTGKSCSKKLAKGPFEVVVSFLNKYDFTQSEINKILTHRPFETADLGSGWNLLEEYFIKVTNGSNDRHTIRDYINMALQRNAKINLNFKGFRSLQEEHDRLSMLARKDEYEKKPPLAPAKEFLNLLKVLPQTVEIPFKLELINTTKRLFEEGIKMKHCVFSYYHQIQDGSCAIFSLVDSDDNHYTLEIQKEKDHVWTDSTSTASGSSSYSYISPKNYKVKYKIGQFKGFRNCRPPEALHKFIVELIVKMNKQFPPKETKRPNDNDYVGSNITINGTAATIRNYTGSVTLNNPWVAHA